MVIKTSLSDTNFKLLLNYNQKEMVCDFKKDWTSQKPPYKINDLLIT